MSYSRVRTDVDGDFWKEYSGYMKQKTSQELMKEFDAKAEKIIKEMEDVSKRIEQRRIMVVKNKVRL